MTGSVHVVCPDCTQVNRVAADRLQDHPRCAACKRSLFQGRPLTPDARTFDRQLSRSDIPIVVDFWADWCGPCKAMAPVLEAAAAQLEPGVRLGKVDVDHEQDIAGRYSIRSIPTLIAFRRGREIARQAGAVPLDALLSWVRRVAG